MTENNYFREIQELYEQLNSSNQININEIDLNNNFKLQNCTDEEVFSFNSKLIKAHELRTKLASAFVAGNQIPSIVQNSLWQDYGLEISSSLIFNNGIECEALKLGAKGWQKGRMKILVNLEFCPDEPDVKEISEINQSKIKQTEELNLDDIRRMINQAS